MDCLEDTVALFVIHEQGFPFWFWFDLLSSTAPWLFASQLWIRYEVYEKGVI